MIQGIEDTVAQKLLFNHISKEQCSYVQWLLSAVKSPLTEPLLSIKTALGFHYFVIAIFQGFARLLMQIDSMDKKLVCGESQLFRIAFDVFTQAPSDRKFLQCKEEDLNKKQQEILSTLQKLVLHNQFLVALICSVSFRSYLEMVTSTQNLFPKHRGIKTYVDFKKDLKGNSISNQDEGGDENEELNFNSQDTVSGAYFSC